MDAQDVTILGSSHHPGSPLFSARWHRGAAIALLALHAVLVWITRGFPAGTAHSDEATYVMLARSLRHLSYRDSYLLDAPIHAQYPPGFPAFLALLSLPFGERYDVYIVGTVLCSVVALALVYDTIRRRSGAGVAIGVLALCAVNPDLLLHASKPYSEPLMMLFMALALWAVARGADDENAGTATRSWAVVAGAAAIGAALTRSAGVTVILALFLVWLLARQYRRAAAFGVSAAVVGSWLVWTVVAPAKIVGRSYIADATFVDPAHPGVFATIADRVSQQVEAYAAMLPYAIPLPTIRGTIVDNVAGIVALAVVGVAGARVLWKTSRIVVVFLVVYAILLAAWPWGLRRFLTPVLPLVLWALVEGTLALAPARGWRRVIPITAAAAILMAAIRRDLATITDTAKCFRTEATSAPACFSPPARGFFEMAGFVKRSTPDSAIVVTAHEAALAYLSGRRVLSSPSIQSADGASFVEHLRSRGSELIALTWIRTPEEQALRWLIAECHTLSVEQEFDAVALLLRVRPRGSAPGDDGCVALDRYRAARFDRAAIR